MTIEEGLRQVLRHPPGWSEIEIIPCQSCEAYRKEIEELRFLLYDALENLKSYRNGGPVF